MSTSSPIEFTESGPAPGETTPVLDPLHTEAISNFEPAQSCTLVEEGNLPDLELTGKADSPETDNKEGPSQAQLEHDSDLAEKLVDMGEIVDGPLTMEGSTDSINPNINEISQGHLGDCYFVASIQALANSPEGREQLKSMITKVDGPDIRGEALEDAFEVKFPGVEKPIRVSMSEINPNGAMQTELDTKDLPAPDGMWMANHAGQVDRNGMDGMWMRILEAAGGKHAGELMGLDMNALDYPSEALPLKPDVNFGLSLLTGDESKGYGMNDWSNSDTYDKGLEYASEGTYLGTIKALGQLAKLGFEKLHTRPAEIIEGNIAEALESGHHAVLGGDNHAYTVLDIEKAEKAEDSLLVLRNPWGRKFAETHHIHRDYSDGTKDGVLKMPIKDAKEMFAFYFVSRDKS